LGQYDPIFQGIDTTNPKVRPKILTVQLENTSCWGKFILREGDKLTLGGKYIKYNTLSNYPENFRGARLLLGGLRPPSPLLSCGPA